MPPPQRAISLGSCANGGGYYHYSYSIGAAKGAMGLFEHIVLRNIKFKRWWDLRLVV